MKAWICVPLIALALAGCAGKTAYRDSCGSQLDAAWHELDPAKAEGFAGTVSYSKGVVAADRRPRPSSNSKASKAAARRPRRRVSIFVSPARAGR